MVQAALGEDFPKPNPFTRFVRSRLEYENGRLISVPSGVDKSNIVMSLAGADALMVLPGGTRGYQRGDEVHVLLLEDDQGSSQPW
ncbi:Molybdopterin molybdenumtransferase [Mycobacteroides abscessus subsp. abscessus]|nr:Molybdopterin molybdenumtransferase [Mycobacteroides abscessus subsp. abscessus]